jgi:hypothetical protein
MKRAILIALAALTLTACGPNQEQRRAAFTPDCQGRGFTPPQCDLLFSMSEKAKSDSDTALIIGAAAMASSGGRR